MKADIVARRRRRLNALGLAAALVVCAHVELLGGSGPGQGADRAGHHPATLRVRMLADVGAVASLGTASFEATYRPESQPESESESDVRSQPVVAPAPPAMRRMRVLPVPTPMQPVSARRAPAGPAVRVAEPASESIPQARREATAESAGGPAAAPSDNAAPASDRFPGAEEALVPTAQVAPSDLDRGDAPVPVPAYATRPPPAAVLVYAARQGGFDGRAELQWRPDGPAYALHLAVRLDGRETLSQSSAGEFDPAGLAPRRFTDRRARRPLLATNFQRDAGKITFSGPADELALPPGMQDRLSWLLQLSAVVAAGPAQRVAGERVVLRVVGARADPSVWVLRFVGTESVETPQGPVAAEHFVREPAGAYDTQARVWLDPQRHHLPVRISLRTGRDGDALELVLDRATIEP